MASSSQISHAIILICFEKSFSIKVRLFLDRSCAIFSWLKFVIIQGLFVIEMMMSQLKITHLPSKNRRALTKISLPLLIITLYFLQGDPFICDQFLWTHWQHWGYCVVCNHEKTAEVPSTNANAFCIWLVLRYIEFYAIRLTQSKSNFFIS